MSTFIVLAAVTDLPTSAPCGVQAAIAAHQAAIAAHEASRAALATLHELFDLEYEIEGLDAIRAALTTIHGPYAAEEIARYEAAETACEAAGWAEIEAWDSVLKFVPDSAEDVRSWVGYVLEHSARADGPTTGNCPVVRVDEVANLRLALGHVAGVLADRLPVTTSRC